MHKKEQYNALDRLGFVLNIILSVLYVPMSLFGLFSVFASDSMFMYPQTIQRIIELMIGIGVSLPFVSVASIVLSIIFRKVGKRILSFVIQFVPLTLFVVMLVIFELVSNLQM